MSDSKYEPSHLDLNAMAMVDEEKTAYAAKSQAGSVEKNTQPNNPLENQSRASVKRVSISFDDLSLKKGIDHRTPWIKGNKNLGVDPNKRAAFFAQRPKVFAAFTRVPQNPLFIEEAHANTESQGPLGEYFIPPEEFAKLIAARIIKYEQNNATEQLFDTENVFIIDNNPAVLEQKLEEHQSTLAKDGGNLKINYIHENHNVTIYLRNCKGIKYCYISDSQGPTQPTKQLIVSITKHFPLAQIIVSPDLQRDYYGCFIYGDKANQLFMKDGDTLFAHIAKVDPSDLKKITEKLGNVEINYSLLSQKSLMPKLLKLSQTLHSSGGVTLSTETLNTIVSQKKNLKLESYLALNTIECDNKKINTAIVMKKYKRTDELEQILNNAQVLSKVKEIYYEPPVSYLIDNKRLAQLKDLLTAEEKRLTAKTCVIQSEEKKADEVSQEIHVSPLVYAITALRNTIGAKLEARQAIQEAMVRQQVALNEKQWILSWLESNKATIDQAKNSMEIWEFLDIDSRLELEDIKNKADRAEKELEKIQLWMKNHSGFVEYQQSIIDQAESSIKPYLEIVEEIAKRLQAKALVLDAQEIDKIKNDIDRLPNELKTMLTENETVSSYLRFLHSDLAHEQLSDLSVDVTKKMSQ